MYQRYSKKCEKKLVKDMKETYLTNEFWFRKMTTYFRRLDIDNDGTITLAEWEDMIERFEAKFPYSDKKGRDKTRQNLLEMWKKFMAGTKDAMSFHDWMLNAVEIPIKRQDNDMNQLITDFTRTFFDAVDQNSDGTISMEEFEHFFECFQIPKSFVPEAFAQIDENKDGDISFEEFKACLKDFFESLEEGTKGTCFFGPLIEEAPELPPLDNHTKHDYLENSFWRRKMLTYFHCLDLDNDGEITMEEWQAVIKRFQNNADKSKANAIRTTMMTIWHMNKGGPKRTMSSEEWLNRCAETAAKSHLEATNTLYRRFAQNYFQAVDLDGDEEISLPEYEAFFDCMGIPTEHAVAGFKAIDTNDDGTISFQEFCDGFISFFFNLDEDNAIGSSFFGPLVENEVTKVAKVK